MSRLINADELIKYIPPEEPLSIFAVANAPTVDAVPVVRCEHCAHKKNCQWYYYSGDDYGFCSWAVREEHETNKR